MLLGVIPTWGYGVLLPTGNDSLTRESNVNCMGANFHLQSITLTLEVHVTKSSRLPLWLFEEKPRCKAREAAPYCMERLREHYFHLVGNQS